METEGKSKDIKSKVSNFFWRGGSVYDAWFSYASNRVAQVQLTLPYSFSHLGMLSGILFQLFYGLMGSWAAYIISVLYVEYRTSKEREKVDFRNHVIQAFNFLSFYVVITLSRSNLIMYTEHVDTVARSS
ncbi:auxin transporter 2 [Olea europaea subsp. europaea]|uniref:Auxin transporter 2 n=1 Tax=Olea europaea subsp. europaea TaxID=158383 RepID=A0A8S0V5L4_OLEEU|nr:auxin transporter 2 [Olea europaea subsp. europaea]